MEHKIGVFRNYKVILVDQEEFENTDTRDIDVICVVRPTYKVYFHDCYFAHYDLMSNRFDKFDKREWEFACNRRKRCATPSGIEVVQEPYPQVVEEEYCRNLIEEYLKGFRQTMEEFYKNREDVMKYVDKIRK